MSHAADRVIEVLNQFTPDGDFNAREVVDKVLAHLWEKEGDLFLDFLVEEADKVLMNLLRTTLLARRREVRRRVRARAFNDKIQEWAAKPEDELIFSTVYVVDNTQTRRKVADMTGRDHAYVAEQYETSASNSKIQAAFHRVIAERVGNRKTSEVLDPQTYLSIWEQIMRVER